MDASVEVETPVSNTIESEMNLDQNVGNLGTDSDTLYVNNKEVNVSDEVSADSADNVIVEETVLTTTMEGVIVNDNIIYQVAENSKALQQFVTECATDGVVTYVTVAPTSNQDTVSTTVKQGVEILPGTYETVPQDNVIVHEESYELPTQSYEKFVQDAVEGEIEEPVTVITERSETDIEIKEEETILEINESEMEDQRTNESTDSIEAKLQELTEPHTKIENSEVTIEESKESTDVEVNDDEVGNEVAIDEQMVIDHSNINETEEHITVACISEKDHPEENVIEGTEITVAEAMVLNTAQSPDDNIEKQLSKIVHDEEPHQLSIAEEISRDFDDSDSDELTVSQQEPHDDVIEEVVNIAKQLGHGPVTVTDTTGQVYYVESVEEVIVVENDSKLEDVKIGKEEEVEEERPVPPPIPSHLLGRNLENPVEDTFRNGKTPPKPRLGVKIPYKNLTSQIVSKDEIAKELLERSKSKMLKNRASREAYFAKQLTRRLAKKIVPTTPSRGKEKEINNSDLIAILEGKDEEKDVQNKSSSDEKNIPMDKKLERELALKQLSELPRRGRRRKDSGYDVIENVNIPPRVRRSDTKSEGREDVSSQKTDPLKVDVKQSNKNLVVATTNFDIRNRPVPPEKNTEANEAKLVATSTVVEVNKGNVNVEKVKPEVKEANIQVEKPSAEKEKSNIDEKMKKTNVDVKLSIDLPTVVKQKMKIDTQKSKGSEPKVIVETSNQLLENNEEISKTHSKEFSKVSSKPGEDTEKKPINLPIKTYERKRKSTDESIIPIPEKKSVVSTTLQTPSNAYVTKSSRIIKKKIIWDPDDPTTVKYAADKISPQKVIKGISSVRVIVKESRKIESPKAEEKSEKVLLKPDKIVSKMEKIVPKSKLISVQKERTPKSPEVASKSKKRLSEVDRLLMDEGAVNLLYSVKNEDTKKFTGTTISLDKVQKELINKTNEIKKELTSSTEKISPKSLRKKESPAVTNIKRLHPASISRKKSKDSNRSSTHSPPASPSPMIYGNHADASRIIRRHSSSSYSSTEGDETNEDKGDKKPAKKRLKKDAEAKPDKQKINDDNFLKLIEENKLNNHNFDYSKFDHYKAIKVGQLNNLIQVSLMCDETGKAFLSYDVLLELTDLLKELQTDDTCKVVVLSSTAPSFCHGINYKSLHIEDEQIKKEIAQKLAKAVTLYLRTLANFPKIIIAGVQGECVGLAVTMLPLFDMVLASDTATFSIPNAKLGCAAEGGSLLSLPHLMHNALVSEMLYASRKFVAAEALRFGMVTRVIWPDKFQTELISAVIEISTHSLQFKQITKRQLRNRMKNQIEESLAGEEDVLLETWISAECQKNFETYD